MNETDIDGMDAQSGPENNFLADERRALEESKEDDDLNWEEFDDASNEYDSDEEETNENKVEKQKEGQLVFSLSIFEPRSL